MFNNISLIVKVLPFCCETFKQLYTFKKINKSCEDAINNYSFNTIITILKNNNFKNIYLSGHLYTYRNNFSNEEKQFFKEIRQELKDDSKDINLYHDVISFSTKTWKKRGFFTMYWLSFFAKINFHHGVDFICLYFLNKKKINPFLQKIHNNDNYYNCCHLGNFLQYVSEYCDLNMLYRLTRCITKINDKRIIPNVIENKNANSKQKINFIKFLISKEAILHKERALISCISKNSFDLFKFIFEQYSHEHINLCELLKYSIKVCINEGISIVTFLLKQQIDVNKYYVRLNRSNYGYSEDDHCDIYSQYESETYLCLAIQSKNYQAAKILLEFGADLNLAVESNNELWGEFSQNYNPERGFTPLHYAVGQNNLELVELLLKHDANVNIENFGKKTPIDLAQNTTMKSILLEKQKTQGEKRIIFNDNDNDNDN